MNKVLCTNILLTAMLLMPATVQARDWGEKKASEAARKIAIKTPVVLDLDKDIVREARDAISQYPSLASQQQNLTISSNDGDVTVRGVLSCTLDRDLLDGVLMKCKSVTSVTDKVEIAPLAK